MVNWSSLVSKASGFNWYIIAAKVLFVVAVGVGSYTMGKHKAELKCEQAKTEQAVKDAVNFKDVIGTSVSTQVEANAVVDAASRLEEEDIAKLHADLVEAIKAAKKYQTTCNLSDQEYNKFNELAKKTRSK